MSRPSLFGRAVDWLLSCLGVGGTFILLTGIAILVGWYGCDLVTFLKN